MNRKVWLLVAFCVIFSYDLHAQQEYVRVENGRLMKADQPYHFLGANYWYGMNLGMEGQAASRERLIRELDHLQSLGVTNLRILGASEGPDTEPYRVVPALQIAPGEYNEAVFQGLDFLLAEMAKRDMTAVVVLNNFWVWSGGMAQYNAWANGEDIPYPPPAPDGNWDTFQKYSSSFYSNKKATKFFEDFLEKIINRENTYTGKLYKQDATIMAWQLANEPRGYDAIPAYRKWIHETAKWIKSMDKQHLVSIGSEGNTASEHAGTDFYQDHQSPYIDYATAHIWVQNWGWFVPEEGEGSLQVAIAKAKQYLNDHVAAAKRLNMPIVLEEFGMPRDGGSYDPQAPVTHRDQFFREIFQHILALAKKDEPIAGANFWSWGGEGRPREPRSLWKPGDDLVGDPPHEHQGWYSIYDKDTSTIEVIKFYAEQMDAIQVR